MQISTDIHGLFILLLAAFTLGSTFLSAYSILNVVRLRNIRLSWKAGKMKGYPVFSTIFLISAILMGIVVHQMSLHQYYPIVGCYVWIGLNWFTASYLASKRYITDHGIVKNINDPSQTVAWYQMTDFVEKTSAADKDYIFIYQENGNGEDERMSKKCIRLELHVPSIKVHQFKKIVSYKLGKTISPELEAFIDVGALK